MKPDLERLCEPARRPFVEEYSTLSGELAAVAEGRKSISFFPWKESSVHDGEETYLEFTRLAVEKGLSILHLPSGRSDEMLLVYAMQAVDTWRAKAHQNLWRVAMDHLPWSDALEAIEGDLLGYTKDEIEEWCRYNRWVRCGWTGKTIYLYLDDEQLKRIAEHGMRCLLCSQSKADLIAFRLSGEICFRTDAAARLAPHRHICRVAVQTEFSTQISSGDRRDSVWYAQLSASDYSRVNGMLLSSVERLTIGKWE